MCTMGLGEESELQDPIDGGKENKTILSEHALRQLSKTLPGHIPNNAGHLEEAAFRYDSCCKAEKVN